MKLLAYSSPARDCILDNLGCYGCNSGSYLDPIEIAGVLVSGNSQNHTGAGISSKPQSSVHGLEVSSVFQAMQD